MLYFFNSFHDGGRYHIETSPMVCRENQWTGFYIITASVMKELNMHCQKKTNKQTSEMRPGLNISAALHYKGLIFIL